MYGSGSPALKPPRTPDSGSSTPSSEIVLLLPALFVFFWMISLSLKKSSTIGTDTSFFPSDPTLDNYSALFNSGSDFSRALVNSFGIAAIATLIAIVLAAMAAYALA